ncbi:MAG: hypothetical protein ACI9AV_002330 [Sediminicola sp.]|jgi:hypothetical protein
MPPTALKNKILNILSIICACHLFFAGLDLPEVFYVYLRVIVSSVALLTMMKNLRKNTIYVIIFGSIAIIFNPIIPIYLYNKTVWVLLDIVTALIFLLEAYDLPTIKSSAMNT